MTNQAELLAALHGMSDVTARAAIVTREKSSRQFCTLRNIFHEGRANGLERLNVPNDFAVLCKEEPQPRIQLVTKEEIEEALLPHTVQWFRQHKETPFGHGEPGDGLGQTCSTPDFQSILDGTYNQELDQLTEEAREWICSSSTRNLLQKATAFQPWLQQKIGLVGGWRCGMKMRESTALALGGHYGHFKTAAIVAPLSKEHLDHTPVLPDVYAIMMSLPLQHGFSPDR
jgi:hypothetical protein